MEIFKEKIIDMCRLLVGLPIMIMIVFASFFLKK